MASLKDLVRDILLLLLLASFCELGRSDMGLLLGVLLSFSVEEPSSGQIYITLAVQLLIVENVLKLGLVGIHVVSCLPNVGNLRDGGSVVHLELSIDLAVGVNFGLMTQSELADCICELHNDLASRLLPAAVSTRDHLGDLLSHVDFGAGADEGHADL